MTTQWPKVSLGELLRLERRPVQVLPDELYQEIGIYCFGRGIFHKQTRTGLEVGEKDLFLLKEGDFILQVTFAWEGAVAIISSAEEGMYGSTRFPTFRIDESRCIPGFLLHYFRTVEGIQQLIKICPGSAGRNRVLSIKRIPEVMVPLPPLAEQRRITERIDELAIQIKAAQSLRRAATEEARTLVANQTQALFECGQKSGWSVWRLDDYVVDDCYGSSEKTHDDSSGTPVLRMGNIQNGRLCTRSLKYLHITGRERDKLILKRGDILVNRTNSAELVGKCAVFDLEGEFAFASYLIRLRLDADKADSRLVALYINSPAGRAYMFSERKQMTGQANVNATKLKALPIALPPLSEQLRLVAELDALQSKVETLMSLQTESAAELDALLPSVLSKAFAGEL
jgi:type I restriction enzyme S subunit